MKIAILTLPLHNNYGGILQCYALQTVLEGMGHQVTVINRRWARPGDQNHNRKDLDLLLSEIQGF